MTTRIILRIAILFFIVSSGCTLSSSEESNNGVGSEKTSKVMRLKEDESITNRVNDSEKHPECPTQCVVQIDVISVNQTAWTNATHYLIPIATLCNKEITESIYWKFLKEHKYVIGGAALGITTFLIVLCIACTVCRRKQRVLSSENDIPMTNPYPDYMEENIIYS